MGLALLFACWPNQDVSHDLQGAGFTPEFSKVIAFVISAMVIYPLSHLGLSILFKEFDYFYGKVTMVKRIIGGCFGGLKGVTLCLLFSNFLLHTPMESDVLLDSRFMESFDLFNQLQNKTSTALEEQP